MKNLLFLTLVVSCFLMGCKSPEATAYKSLGSIAITVNAALHAYYDFRATGRVDPSVDAKIRDGYWKYQQAFKVAESAQASFKLNPANKPFWDAALSALSASSSDLIALIRTLVPTVRPTS